MAEEADGPPRSGRAWILAALTAFAWLAVSLPLLPAYGATWDCVSGEYPYGERILGYLTTGDEQFLSLSSYEPRPKVREPHPDFDTTRFEWFGVHPLGALLSALSCRVLWTELGWIPALQAHNLVIPLAVAALLALLVRFAQPRVGALAAVSGALFLVASPRFFAHSFFNLKDVPETCLYVAATLLGYLALTRGGWRWWMGAGALTGLALAQKSNAIFVPFQLAVFAALAALVPRWRRSCAIRWSRRGVVLGVVVFLVAYYAASPRYWTDPIAGPAGRLGTLLTMSEREWHSPASGGAWKGWSALLFVATTTPLAVLLFAPLGLIARRIPTELRVFLIAALFVTIGRNIIFWISNFDGVRHFLEFYPYLCLAAGIGLASLARRAAGWSPRAGPLAAALFVGAGLLPPILQTARTHPNGIAYFNALVGGLDGAQARSIPGATDYWGNAYWQAFAWLNENAEPEAAVLVPIAGHVAQAIAPVRLRADLRLQSHMPPAPGAPLFIAYVTRENRYMPLIFELEARYRPLHEITVQGGVVLRIFRLEPGEAYDRMLALWENVEGVRQAVGRLARWMERNPEEALAVWALFRETKPEGRAETLARLRPRVPEDLREELEIMVENHFDKLQYRFGRPRGSGTSAAVPLEAP